MSEHQMEVGLAGLTAAVEASCARVGVTVETAFQGIGQLLATVLELSKKDEVEPSDAEMVARGCFEKVRRSCLNYVLVGGQPSVPHMLGEAFLAIGWLAELMAVRTDPTGRQGEAAQNCIDACIRLHVFTGAYGSDVMLVCRGIPV